MNRQMKTSFHLGTHPTISTVIIAALAVVVPTSAVRGQYIFPAGYDWKLEIEQTFGLSSEDVEQGSLNFFLEEDCPPMIEKYGSCFGNNPASPYGMYELGDFSEPADAARWRLAEHQAVLFIGMTPPTARYYSFQTYPFSRHENNRRLPREDGEVRFCDEWAKDGTCLAPRQTLVGKIGLNLNHLEIMTDGGDEDSFERMTVVVTTANRAVEARIRQLLPNRLAELGISPNIINIDPIPCASTTGDGTCDDADPQNLVLGSEPESDDFLMAMRLSMGQSLAARQAYMDAPPVSVLRVSFPDLVGTFSPYDWAPVPAFPEAAVFNEDPYEDALEWLAEQIRLVYNPGGRIGSFTRGGGAYYDCMINERSCNAGSEDAYYSKGPNISKHCLGDDRSVFVVGVNHSQVGPYSYSSLSIRDPDERHEIGYFADIPYIVPNTPEEEPNPDGEADVPPYLEGSVEHFLPRDLYPRPDALEGKLSKLFVAEITPTCDHPHCIAASAEELPGELLGFQERTYLNTIVGTRPGPDNFIASKLVGPSAVECQPVGEVCPGDFGTDGLVDLEDHTGFGLCLSGVDTPVVPGCEAADTDEDGDADMRDFAALQNSFTGCRSCGDCRDAPALVPGETALDYWRIVTPNARARGAVCNDGCPYVYYVRPGRDGNDTKWILFLKGGASCTTVENCNRRWGQQQHWMRPRPLNWRPPIEGIFNPDTTRNPDWGDWTLVYLHYCSSDLFIGAREASCDSGGWHFRGKRIVAAVIEDMLDPPGGLPSLADATEVMLIGGSAGAAGVRHNLDLLHDTLSHARVVGVPDSATAPIVVPGSAEWQPQAAARKWELWQPQPDASCLAAEEDPLDCLDGINVLLNHVTTPFFLYMDQFDTAALDGQNIDDLCITTECTIDDDCAPGRTCLNGICFGPACDENNPCAEGSCNETGLCYGAQCTDDVDCMDGDVCAQGFCSQELPACEVDADCNAVVGEFCLGGSCARRVACGDDGDCAQEETCIQDVELCIRLPGCSSDASCEEGKQCLGKWLTPYAQRFAFDLRGLLEPLDGAFSTRWGTHVLVVKPRFFNGRVNGLNYATVLANWYFGLPGPTNVIDYP